MVGVPGVDGEGLGLGVGDGLGDGEGLGGGDGDGDPPSEHVVLGDDGDVAQVSFDFEPGEAGTFVYQLRIKAPADDGNPRDNQREAEVEVVDRQTRVLL